MIPGTLMALWQARWVDLTPEQAEQFLRREEVAEICKYSDNDIRRCLRRYQKLAHILQCLQKGPRGGGSNRWRNPPPLPRDQGPSRDVLNNVGRGKRSR